MTINKHTSINARQIKAARALLDWSQEQLAEACGLSIATIRKIEAGNISPRGSTMGSIERAFEVAGLEFWQPNGVRQRPEEITVYEGHEGIVSFFDDVYSSAIKGGTEVVVVCANEHDFDRTLNNYGERKHIQRMTAARDRISVKCILTEDKDHLPATYCEYRWLSKHYVDSVPFYIYGDKYAIIVFDSDPSPKITVLQSPVVASAFRRQFYSMWDKATPLNPMQAKTSSDFKSQKKRKR
ncbi:MAG: helix-turn-helix transcriptional regulator [Alphaproteobacteria bacterium]|nr:helix-turn-helix transcriptional regulator [Alphaproteobacteria bacterium]